MTPCQSPRQLAVCGTRCSNHGCIDRLAWRGGLFSHALLTGAWHVIGLQDTLRKITSHSISGLKPGVDMGCVPLGARPA